MQGAVDSAATLPIQTTGDGRSIERGSFALTGADCKAALKGWEAWMEGEM
jgi:allophanate hydrolase subunit 2